METEDDVKERKSGSFGVRRKQYDHINWDDIHIPWNFYLLMLLPMRMVMMWLMNHGILRNEMTCSECNAPCVLTTAKKPIDGCWWMCSVVSRHTYSIRMFSFFSRSKLHIQDIMQFIYGFSQKLSLKQSATNCGLSYGSTAVDWVAFIREILKEWVHVHLKNVMFTGEVEIDESMFGRRSKYHRGRRLGIKVWIVGLVERATNRILLFPVENRDSSTLTNIITSHVAPGSTIYTDTWAGYSRLNSLGYRHFTVCHKYRFRQVYVNSNTGQQVEVNTNQIEGAWAHAKAHFRKIFGSKIGGFEGHLAEILYRNHHQRGPFFQNFLHTLKEVYTLEGPPVYTYSTPLFPSWTPNRNEFVDSFLEQDGDEMPTTTDDITSGPPDQNTDEQVGDVVMVADGRQWDESPVSTIPMEDDNAIPPPLDVLMISEDDAFRNVTLRKKRVTKKSRRMSATITRQSPDRMTVNSPTDNGMDVVMVSDDETNSLQHRGAPMPFANPGATVTTPPPKPLVSAPEATTKSSRVTKRAKYTFRKKAKQGGKTKIPYYCPKDFQPLEEESDFDVETQTRPSTRKRKTCHNTKLHQP